MIVAERHPPKKMSELIVVDKADLFGFIEGLREIAKEESDPKKIVEAVELYFDRCK